MLIRKDFSSSNGKMEVFLTIGFFDGIHLGHRRIIEKVVERAKKEGCQSCVVTFNRHPDELFSGKKVFLLTSWEEKRELFEEMGVDVVQIFTFDRKFAALSPEAFLEKLNKIFKIRQIIVGEEFVFGAKKSGDIAFLTRKASEFGFTVEAHPCVRLDGEKISSSLLRKWFQEGKIKKVIAGLGRFPTIYGKVTPGRKKGRELGYPTANLEPHPEKLLPAKGVYAGYVRKNGEIYKALANIGERPTFGDFTCQVEVHLMGFEGELYGEIIKMEVVEKIRD
ncbi:riboflavin biosynthesis protein RibF, partial [Candidatus Aerophobetes bacterium]|nr:riboflavin biosynthesis protein RibF [Candidatus Aerophobetes bacterium]